jgi:hypothetical protein
MPDVFDINLAAASTGEFLRQGGRLADVPRLWWNRFRGVIWLAEWGIIVEPTLEYCPPDQIPEELASQFRSAWWPLRSKFSNFRFVRAAGLAVQRACSGVAVAQDRRCLCQFTRVESESKTWLSVNFTSAHRDGTMLVTGNASRYWDSPKAVRTQHLVGRSTADVAAKHQRWLARHADNDLVRYTADDALPVMQKLVRVLVASYIRRGLYVVRNFEDPVPGG